MPWSNDSANQYRVPSTEYREKALSSVRPCTLCGLKYLSAKKKSGRVFTRPNNSVLGTRNSVLSSPKPCRLHRLPRNFGGRRDALHAQLEVVGVRRVLQRSLVVDQPRLEQIPQRLIEGLHAVLRSTRRNRIANRARLLGHQHALSNVSGIDHHLDRRNAPVGIAAPHQSLTDNGPQHGRQLHTNLLLLRRR